MSSNKNSVVKRILVIAVIVILAFVLVVLPAASMLAYCSVFGVRYSTPGSVLHHVEDFDGLRRDRYEFASNEGQRITGYNYFRDDQDIKGMVIFAHGIGAGHNSYMDVIEYFTHYGYYVFAYDVTGNDESEGLSINGLPQGVIDLDHAITFVENQPEFSGLPIVLLGHSWGGFSVANVLNFHPEVKAVCSVSGFNRSSDLLNAQGQQMVGPAINIMLPYLDLYERVRFGDYATHTSMDGFKNSDARIMIVHSEDDTTVPITYGYDIYYAEYADDPDFVFIRYTDRGHGKIFSKSPELLGEVVEFFDESIGAA